MTTQTTTATASRSAATAAILAKLDGLEAFLADLNRRVDRLEAAAAAVSR